MLNFFKVFGRGVITTVLLPLILLVWVLYGVYCLIVFIVMFIKSTVLFFMGDSIKADLPEDVEAKRILLENEQAQSNQQQFYSNMNTVLGAMAQQMQQNIPNQQPNYQQGISQEPTNLFPTPEPETIEYQDVPEVSEVAEEEKLEENSEEGGSDDVQSY